MSYLGRNGRPAGKYKPHDYEMRLITVACRIPVKYLRRIDAYCDETRTPRSDFLKASVFCYLKEMGMFTDDDYAVPDHERVGSSAKKDPEPREPDPGSWVINSGDFGEPDQDPDVPPNDYAEGEETGI